MKGWEVAPLGDVAELLRGITFKPGDVVSVGSAQSVACMRTKNVQATLDVSDVWAVDERFVRRPNQFLEAGDVLVSSANSWNLVGKCCWIPELPWRATFGGFVSVLRSRRDRLYPRFLYHWFSSESVQANVRSFGNQTTNISNLSAERCLALCLPLPPVPEQLRIAEVLDRAEALRAKRRAALAQVDGLTQAIFFEMFGDPEEVLRNWRRITLEEVLETGPQNGLYKPASDYGSGTPILRIDGFYDGIVTGLGTLKRVRVSAAERGLYGLEPGDIVVNRVNSIEYLGKSALIPTLGEPTVFESNMMRFRLARSSANPRFIVQLLQSSAVRKQILTRAKRAVNQASVNQQDIKALRVILPPLPLQAEFARRAAAVERLNAVHRVSLARLDALFASLQHRAFRGEL